MATTLPGIDEMRPGFAGEPLPGISLNVVDEDGREATPGEAGYLFVTSPWPGMPVSLANGDGRLDHETDHPRRRDGEWSYFTGDRAVRDRAGRLRLLGRVEDVVSVKEARFTTTTFESAILAIDGVAEAAVVNGAASGEERLYAFVSLVDESETTPSSIRERIAEVVGDRGSPMEVVFTPELPKTRSGKIMRRLLRDVTAGGAVNDTSALCNPEVIGELRSVIDEPN
jgi:acetyl-CoA synthetase